MKKIRKITNKEIKTLKTGCIKTSGLLQDYIMGIIFPFGILSVPYLLLQKRFVLLKRFEIIFAIFAVIGAVVFSIIINKSNWRSFKKSKNINLNSEVIEEEFEIKKIIKVEEHEDIGVGFFIEVGDNKILYLHGQYLYDYEKNGYFIGNRVQTTRLRDTGTLIDFDVHGEMTEIGFTRKPYTKEEFRNGAIHKDGEIFEGNIDNIKNDFVKMNFELQK